MLYIIYIILFSLVITESEWESEHPPLSDGTKAAIAAYKKNPTDENKEKLKEELIKTYDWVIENKQNNYAKYTAAKEESIENWMKLIRAGKLPPFMELKDDKDEERQAVSDAIENYKTTKDETNVINALTAYYDKFLEEQYTHIQETIEAKDEKIEASLEYFTSDRFNPSLDQGNTYEIKDLLAEIICSYISVGAQILPVNPDARVRERTFNAAINNAQKDYLENKNEINKNILIDNVTSAFETALEVRIEEFEVAKNKGIDGGNNLLEKIQDNDILNSMYEDLTEQRNLYGRIDRIVTFGNNTASSTWIPRLQTLSQELFTLISSDEKDNEEIESKFKDIYEKMLKLHEEHLNKMKKELNTYINNVLYELTGEYLIDEKVEEIEETQNIETNKVEKDTSNEKIIKYNIIRFLLFSIILLF